VEHRVPPTHPPACLPALHITVASNIVATGNSALTTASLARFPRRLPPSVSPPSPPHQPHLRTPHLLSTRRFLLLEDPETGDVLMPLIYMKPILEANYSRKLAALKHRQVAGECAHA
jgi:hypothetical protein